MKYNDIKLAERETADQKLVRTYCDGISQGAVNSVRWKSSKYLDRAIQTATKFAKANPKFAAEIEACITSGRAKYAKGGGTVTKQGREINRFRNTDGTGTGPTGPYKDGGYGGNGVGTNSSVGTDTSVGSDNGVAQGVDITGTTPMQKAADQLEGLLNAEDWAGAKALLDSNSDLKALFPPEYQDMIDAAIQADIDAIETKEKADAQAAIQKQAKEDAKIAAEQAAAKKAAEEAEAAAEIAAERQRLADLAAAEAAEAERLKTLEDEKAAAKAKADEAAKIAAAEKAEAEKLEAAKIAAKEAEKERQRIADEEAEKERLRKEKEEERNKTAPGDNLEEPDKVYDWDDL